MDQQILEEEMVEAVHCTHMQVQEKEKHLQKEEEECVHREEEH